MPASFSEERPGFSYSHVQYDTTIDEHPLASQLPKATTHPSVQTDPAEFRSLAQRPNGPTILNDYLYSDEPPISLHVVSFEDATLLSLSWPHTFMDAMGRAALFNAWKLMLDGRENEVPPFYGFDEDPLGELGSYPTEEYILAHLLIKGFGKAILIFRTIFALLRYRRESGRIVCIPASTFATLRETALNDLPTHNPNYRPSFLSDGDVLSAFWSKTILQEMPSTWNMTVNIMNAFGLRGVLSNDLLPPDKAYISNARSTVQAILPCSRVLSEPVSFTAAVVRRSIIEQGTRAQVEAFANLRRKTLSMTIFGDSNAIFIIYTNWTKARFYEIDFGTAVVKAAITVEQRTSKRGTPSYIHVSRFVNSRLATRNLFTILGKDQEGNYWTTGFLREGIWEKVEKALACF